MYVLLTILILIGLTNGAGNRCHFTIDSKVYILKPLQKSPYYNITQDDNIYLFNFCQVVDVDVPANCNSAYSIRIDDNNTCTQFSSDRLIDSYSSSIYTLDSSSGIMLTEYNGQVNPVSGLARSTQFIVICGDNQGYSINSIVDNEDLLQIVGTSINGCPFLEVSKLWEALKDNQIIFGIIIFLAGVLELFFGRKMLNPTLFICCYCIGFAVVGATVSELLIKVDSTFLWTYFCLIIIIFVSSVFAYTALKLAHISIFFIGAWMGLIIAALVNTIFIKLTGISSTWSLVAFGSIFCIGLGLLTFKIYDQIIVLSTSITGAYMVIRPISWIFGGYPNEFLLAQQIQAGQIGVLPSAFFIYVAFIVALATIGAMYQFLQIKRENSGQSIQVGAVEEKIQSTVDMVKDSITALINKYRTQQPDIKQEGPYVQFQQMKRKSHNSLSESFKMETELRDVRISSRSSQSNRKKSQLMDNKY